MMSNLLLEIPAPPQIVVPVILCTAFVIPICLILYFEYNRKKGKTTPMHEEHSEHAH